jgi:hypothetical protein
LSLRLLIPDFFVVSFCSVIQGERKAPPPPLSLSQTHSFSLFLIPSFFHSNKQQRRELKPQIPSISHQSPLGLPVKQKLIKLFFRLHRVRTVGKTRFVCLRLPAVVDRARGSKTLKSKEKEIFNFLFFIELK